MGNSLTGEKLSSPPARRRLSWLHVDIPEVWIRFLLALAGLVLAFTAALFSTVFRQAGNLWGTLILASIALLLAIIVGLTTVPYLAQRVAAARLRNVVDYQVTRLGVIYTIVVLLIGIAALNTGNNLLYIVVAAMLAAIVVSGAASNLVLRDLELDLRLPEYVFAGDPVRGHLSLRNPRRWLPSFSVSVAPVSRDKPARQWQWTPATFAFPPWKSPQQQWLRLPDRKLHRVNRAAVAKNIFSGMAYFPYISSRAELSADFETRFSRRGRYQEEGFGLSSRFPFAFLTKTRRVPLARELIVFPAVTAPDDQAELLPRIAGEFETFLRGRGTDLYRLREYTPGDSARHVDWKATAKTGSLKLREFSREDNRKLRIVFDNPNPGKISAAQYEKAVAAAASLGWHFARQDFDVSFVGQEYSGDPNVYHFLGFLATVRPCRLPSLLESLEPSIHYNIIITSRDKNEIPPHLRGCSYFIFVSPSR